MASKKMQPRDKSHSHSHPGMSMAEKEKYVLNFQFPFCDEASKYEQIAKIGQGTFG